MNRTCPAPRARNLTRGSACPRFSSKTSGRGELDGAELRGAASDGSTAKADSIRSGKTTPTARPLRNEVSMRPPGWRETRHQPCANEDLYRDRFLAQSV